MKCFYFVGQAPGKVYCSAGEYSGKKNYLILIIFVLVAVAFLTLTLDRYGGAENGHGGAQKTLFLLPRSHYGENPEFRPAGVQYLPSIHRVRTYFLGCSTPTTFSKTSWCKLYTTIPVT